MKNEKYLLKIDQKLRLIPLDKIKEMPHSMVTSMSILLREEQRKQLMSDALDKNDECFYGRKIVDALELSISKLEEIFPFIVHQKQIMHRRSVSN